MSRNSFKIKILLFFLFFSGYFFIAEAATLNEQRSFYVDSSYDLYGREKIDAQLIKITNSLYFYVDKSWWEGKSTEDRDKISIELDNLSNEFEQKIYPTLTLNFGSEWKPGIDNDVIITVLIQPIIENTGGYFNSGDEYSRLQVPTSNEREMIYLNTKNIGNPILKSLVAHELVHLITFNQKEKIRGGEEEVWLNEARAEYAPTLLGYDAEYKGSNLQRRVTDFLNNPSDSITEWRGLPSDYGALNLFTQYLVDHYGMRILVDSLQSSKKGIESINYALTKNNFKEDFSQVFTDWTIAVLVNDCSLGERYCYKNTNLKDLRVVPTSYFLPITADSTLSVYYDTKNWVGNWQKIFGGKGDLTLEFEGNSTVKFKVPYVICEHSNVCAIKFLDLDTNQKGKITFSGFNTKYTSLTVIPSIQSKLSGFGNLEPKFPFSWTVKTSSSSEKEEDQAQKLLAQIDYLKAEIIRIQNQIDAILGKNTNSCKEINNNLYFGIMNNSEVRCFQQFLKDQRPEIYPEGLVTGNFLSLTKNAVIRFQERYSSEILLPLGLEKGTGYVGAKTRAKINQLLGY
jgi:peptidoglycan hydrolase-like protein with peptidoglycan-binding domain